MVGHEADGGNSRVQRASARRRAARVGRGDLEIGSLAAWSHTLDDKRRELLAGVGHELKTPLSIVLGLSARLLGHERMPADQRDDVERIRANAYVLLKRVEDVLAVARLDSGAVELDLHQVDVAALARDSCEGFRSVAELRGQRLEVETPPSLVALVDEDRILSVVSNLVANALRHAPAGGVVRCTLSAREGRMTLEVADSGPGVAAGVRAQIFERYQQSRVDGATGGTGLGLAIVREVVVLHGGRVTIGDAPEGGAAFVVDLPLRSGDHDRGTACPLDVADRQRATVERLRAQLAANRSAPAVADDGAAAASALIVTTDAQLAAYVQDLIGPPYSTHHAGDALEAARWIAGRRPDVVLVDAAIGGMAVGAIRRRTAAVPILAFAASLQDVSGLMEAGADDCVVKPFATEDLRARVAALVARGRAASERAAMFGALEKAFEASPAPMALISRDGRFVRVTRALCELLDVGADELRNATVDDITHPTDLSAAGSGRRRVLAGGPIVDRGRWRVRRGDGSFVAVDVTTSLADELEGHLLWQLAEDSAEPEVEAHRDAALASRTRRAFERSVYQQLLRCRRYGEQAALVRCSLDDLARVRAAHGDDAADVLAGLVFNAVRRRLRDTDVVTRLGDGEIGALLPHAGPEAQRAAAEGIRAAAEGERVYTPSGAVGTHVRVGVASLSGVGSLARAFAVADLRRRALPAGTLHRAGST